MVLNDQVTLIVDIQEYLIVVGYHQIVYYE